MGIAVGELRLRAPRRDAVPPVVGDLADALHTASLPTLHAGEILVVRRLDLGRIPAGLPRQALARRIEARLAGCRIARWRPGTPLPADAPAVAFPGLVEAALALLVSPHPDPVRDAALAAVFGPAAPRPGPEAFPALLARVLALGPAPAGRLLIELERAGRLAALLAALPLSEAATLRRRLPTRLAVAPSAALAPAPPVSPAPRPARAPSPDAIARAVARVLPGAPAAAHAILSRALAAGPDAGHREALTVELVLHAVAGPTAIRPILDAVARAAIRPQGPISAPPRKTPLPTGIAAPPAPSPLPVPAEIPRADVRRHPPEPAPAPLPIGPTLAEPAEDADAALAPRSTGAGLFLLLRLFRLLDLERAEAALAAPLQAMLLAGFARRLGLRPDDPLANALPTVPQGLDASRATTEWAPAPPVLALLPPAAWGSDRLLTAGHGRLVLGGRPRAAPALPAILRGQALALQVLARRLTGLGWRAVARRPAAVACTRSHLDLTFDADAIDLGLRRAGLDLDPGWVPFLGRVVTFRYDDAGLVHHLPRWPR